MTWACFAEAAATSPGPGSASAMVDPEAAVRDYHVALRSASPAVLTAVHAEALETLGPADLTELRRRLDARLAHPRAPGDASVDAVASDLGQLASTGSGAVIALIEDAGQRDAGQAGASQLRQVDEERLAVAFVASHVWRVVNGEVPPSTRDGLRGDAAALAFAELHKLRNSFGPGSSLP